MCQDSSQKFYDEQQALHALQSKAQSLSDNAHSLNAQRREALQQAENAEVKLREEEIKLERELQASKRAGPLPSSPPDTPLDAVSGAAPVRGANAVPGPRERPAEDCLDGALALGPAARLGKRQVPAE